MAVATDAYAIDGATDSQQDSKTGAVQCELT